MTPAFAPGQRVRIADRDAPGHVRTPVYVRGLIGVIERVLPRFLDPEREAYGVNAGTEVQLYRAGTDGWTEEQLAALVTRDSMIGVSRARTP